MVMLPVQLYIKQKSLFSAKTPLYKLSARNFNQGTNTIFLPEQIQWYALINFLQVTHRNNSRKSFMRTEKPRDLNPAAYSREFTRDLCIVYSIT